MQKEGSIKITLGRGKQGRCSLRVSLLAGLLALLATGPASALDYYVDNQCSEDGDGLSEGG